MDFNLSLVRLNLASRSNNEVPEGICMLFVLGGTVEVGDTKVGTGNGLRVDKSTVQNTSDTEASILLFTLSKNIVDTAVESRTVSLTFPFLFRLDEVTFPPGAIAYRHIHPGDGFRHLRKGALHLEADDHSFDAKVGDTWFEPANSPVRATASLDHERTQFVRCMVLPTEFKGKSTIQILSKEDAQQPKLQATHRHFDEIIDGWS